MNYLEKLIINFSKDLKSIGNIADVDISCDSVGL